MITPLSYCYLPDDYEGHRPANREEVERVGRGAVYSWPSTTTMHMDLMTRCRRTLDAAAADGIMDEAAHRHEEGFIQNEALKEGQEHRSGCPAQRTGKCLCDYLSQWDKQRNEGGIPDPVSLEASKERLADFTAQMSDEGRVITIDTLHGRTSEWDGVFTPRDIEGNPMPADTARLHNTELSLTFWKGQAKHWQKGYWFMAGAAVLGWGFAVARGVWGF